MKVIPNCISFSRIVFSLMLIFVKPLSEGFYVLYIACGISDILDGFIARRFGAASRLGEKLDSIADMIMTGVLIAVLYPTLKPTAEIVLWIALIAIVRLASMVTALIKYKAYAVLHTYGNKAAGIALFMLPLLLPYISKAVLLYIVCTIASISAAEELVIQLTSKELQVNRQSIFVK